MAGEEYGVKCKRNGSQGARSDQRGSLVRGIFAGTRPGLTLRRGASSTLMNEIAQGYVLSSSWTRAHVLTQRFRTFNL